MQLGHYELNTKKKKKRERQQQQTMAYAAYLPT